MGCDGVHGSVLWSLIWTSRPADVHRVFQQWTRLNVNRSIDTTHYNTTTRTTLECIGMVGRSSLGPCKGHLGFGAERSMLVGRFTIRALARWESSMLRILIHGPFFLRHTGCCACVSRSPAHLLLCQIPLYYCVYVHRSSTCKCYCRIGQASSLEH